MRGSAVEAAETVTCCAPIVREPLSVRQAVELSHVLKALSDPVRLRLLSMIASHRSGEACVCDLAEVFELSGPTISYHLKVLRLAGLVETDRRRTWVYYRIRPEVLSGLARILGADEPDSLAAVLPIQRDDGAGDSDVTAVAVVAADETLLAR